MTGTIAHLKLERGFGFIHVTGEQKGIFFHCRDTELPWDEHLLERRVEFEVAENEKGKHATNVRAANP
jgi:cold shock CspA family protein